VRQLAPDRAKAREIALSMCFNQLCVIKYVITCSAQFCNCCLYTAVLQLTAAPGATAVTTAVTTAFATAIDTAIVGAIDRPQYKFKAIATVLAKLHCPRCIATARTVV
jgi:hypothetical protein